MLVISGTPAPSIGKLRHRVRIEEKIRTSDGAGGAAVTWQEVVTIYCEIIPLGGMARLAAEQAESTISLRIRLRWRDGLRQGQRVVKKGPTTDRYFMIENVVDPDERRNWLILDCSETMEH